MISKQIQEKGILAKLLEKGIKIILKKECRKIEKIKIDIIASSIQILKGIIHKISISAEEINYKDLLFDEIKLEADEVKIFFKLNNKEFNLKNNFFIKVKISLSENSLKKILSSNRWEWIGNMISNEISNQDKLKDIEIKNDKIIIKTFKDNNTNNEGEKLDIKAENGKIYLENKSHNKSFKIPIEDKIYINNININNNSIIIYAKSSISLN